MDIIGNIQTYLSVDYNKKNDMLRAAERKRCRNGVKNQASSLRKRAILFGIAFIFLCNPLGQGRLREQ